MKMVTLGRSRRREKDFQDIESTGEVPVCGVLSNVLDHWNSISLNRLAKFVAVYLELKTIGTIAKESTRVVVKDALGDRWSG